MSDSEDLQKQVQEKLAQCHKLLEECVELAEEGSFEFSFDAPGTTYYPTNMYSNEEVIEYLVDIEGDEWDAELSPEERGEVIDGARSDMVREQLPEYAEPGSWWMPSRNC